MDKMILPYVICFFVALAFVIAGLLAVVIVRKRSKETTARPINLMLAATFVSGFTIFLPIYGEMFRGDQYRVLKTILVSIHNAIRLFIVDGEFDIIRDNVPSAIWIGPPYALLSAILFVLAPLLTFGLILSLIRNAYSHLALMFSHFGVMFVFSELNDRAAELAVSLRAKYPSAKIIFTDVYEAESETDNELLQKARSLNVLFFSNDIEFVNFSSHSKAARITFFVIGNEESENLRQAMNLIHRYHDRDNTELYVFSSTLEGEMLLSDLDKGKVKVRRINADHALINKFLYDEGECIFDGAMPAEDGQEKEIRALIAGLDRCGREMFKALSWFCQMDGYRLKINAFDKDPLIEDKVRAACPELLDPRINGADVPDGEAVYDIQISPEADFATDSFLEKLAAFRPTFVFVSLGSDSENISEAVRIRTVCERNGLKPHIVTICTDPNINKGLRNIHNFRGQKYDIRFIGSLDDMYSGSSIIGRDLEAEALKRHLQWGSEDDFWNYEYNYKSSIATTIHAKMKKHCGIEGSMKKGSELTAEERDALERLEHRRWNAYMRSEGYVYGPERNDLGRVHYDLVPYNDLSEEEKRKDSKVAADVES